MFSPTHVGTKRLTVVERMSWNNEVNPPKAGRNRTYCDTEQDAGSFEGLQETHTAVELVLSNVSFGQPSFGTIFKAGTQRPKILTQNLPKQRHEFLVPRQSVLMVFVGLPTPCQTVGGLDNWWNAFRSVARGRLPHQARVLKKKENIPRQRLAPSVLMVKT